MSLKKFKNITPAELKAKGVVALADKPNLASSYGEGGLSATALKLWFDQIGNLLSDKINAIQDALSGDDAANYLKLNLAGLDALIDSSENPTYTLQDLIDAIRNGKLAEYALVKQNVSAEELTALQSVLNTIDMRLSELAEQSAENIEDHVAIRQEIDDDVAASEERADEKFVAKENNTEPLTESAEWEVTETGALQRTATKRDITTGETSTVVQTPIPMVNNKARLFRPEEIEELETLKHWREINNNKALNHSVDLSDIPSNLDTSESAVQEYLTQKYNDVSGTTGNPTMDLVTLIDDRTNAKYVWYVNHNEWRQSNSATGAQATNKTHDSNQNVVQHGTSGIVKGSDEKGKIFVEIDNTMSLNGYDEIVEQIRNNTHDLQTKANQTEMEQELAKKANLVKKTREEFLAEDIIYPAGTLLLDATNNELKLADGIHKYILLKYFVTQAEEKSKIYGVDGVGQLTPSLTRTDDATGLNVEVGASEIKSDFDKCYPWSDMKRVTDGNGNVFVQIPKFYAKRTSNGNGTEKWQISGTRYDGFSTLFVDGKGNEIDYVRVGAYEGSGSSSRVYSKSGQSVLVNVTLKNMRDGCTANGAGYQQYDFLIDWIIKYLFTIEFATTNSQAIMKGFTDSGNSAAQTTGQTDSIATASGSPTSNTDGRHSCKYRGIENPWGNTWTFVDGISFSSANVYVCEDPTGYESGKTTAPYQLMGTRPTSDGWNKSINSFANNPLLGYTSSATGGSDSTYFSDYTYNYSGGQILRVGGRWNSGSSAGLWYWAGNYDVSYSNSALGGRLCYKPL